MVSTLEGTDSPKHKLVAIMFTDIAGYTSMMQRDEQKAVQLVKRHRRVVEEMVATHHGELIQHYGDGSLSIFASARDAVKCAMRIQADLQTGLKVPLRIGIHLGEVLLESGNVFGDGVNLASRIEALGVNGSILFSLNVYQQIMNIDTFQAVSLGHFSLKNVERKVEVFALANPGLAIPQRSTESEENGERHTQKQRSWISRLLGWSDTPKPATKAVTAPAPPPQIGKKSIVVLPFDNYNDLANEQYLVEGIGDEIRAQLLRIKDLKVISRSSSKYCKGRQMSLRQIGEELRVEHVLDGSIQKMSDEIKISVELSNTQTDKVIWSRPPYRYKLADIFQLQNNIAQQIVDELKLELSDEERSQLVSTATHDSEAIEYTLKGREILNRGGGKISELIEAEQMFKTAIELAPAYSRAYVGLCDTCLQKIYWGRVAPDVALSEARVAASKALELDPVAGESYGAMGAIYLHRGDKARSKVYFEKAIELSPSYAEAYVYLSRIWVIEGKFTKAEQVLRQASELDPLSMRYIGDMAQVKYYARQFAAGVELLRSGLEKHPQDNNLLWTLGYLYTGQGYYEKAIETFQSRSVARTTNWMLAYAWARSGEEDKAREVLRYQLRKNEDTYVPGVMLATIYMGLGETDDALEWLEKDAALGGKDLMFWALKHDPKFVDLHDHPRFRAIVEGIFEEP